MTDPTREAALAEAFLATVDRIRSRHVSIDEARKTLTRALQAARRDERAKVETRVELIIDAAIVERQADGMAAGMLQDVKIAMRRRREAPDNG